MLVSQINEQLKKLIELSINIESRTDVLLNNIETDRYIKKLISISTYAGSKLTNDEIKTNVKFMITDDNLKYDGINYITLHKLFNKSNALCKIDAIDNLFENATELIIADCSYMFNECVVLEEINSMENMFKNCKNLCSANLQYMFNDCVKLNKSKSNNLDYLSKGLFFNNMFEKCSKLSYVNFHKMFNSCMEIKRIDSTKDMFLGCNDLHSIDFSFMFANCQKLEEISFANIFNGIPDDQKIKINTEHMFNQSSKQSYGILVYLDYYFDSSEPTKMIHIPKEEFHISKHLYPIIRELPDESMIAIEEENYEKVKEWVTELGEIQIEIIEHLERYIKERTNKNKKRIYIKSFNKDIEPRNYKYWLE